MEAFLTFIVNWFYIQLAMLTLLSLLLTRFKSIACFVSNVKIYKTYSFNAQCEEISLGSDRFSISVTSFQILSSRIYARREHNLAKSMSWMAKK